MVVCAVLSRFSAREVVAGEGRGWVFDTVGAVPLSDG